VQCHELTRTSPPEADQRRKVEVRLSRAEHERLEMGGARDHLGSASAEARFAIVRHLEAQNDGTRSFD
jgi:hypothetical protein